MRNPFGQDGAVFLDCRLTRAAHATRVYLARIDPNVFSASAVAFLNCTMDGHISPAGWLLDVSGPTEALRFWEYHSTGLTGVPLDIGERATCSSQITADAAAKLRERSRAFPQ
jgi:pectin methylesterase-like acyl-CoA thioesterase